MKVSQNVKNSVRNITYVAQQISGEGFNDRQEGSVEETLAEVAVEPTNRDLDETAKQSMESAMTRTVVKVSLRLQESSPSQQPKYQNGILPGKKIFSDVEKCDPTPDCSLTFKRLTSTTFIPYSERRKDLRQKAEWMRLKQFLQPVWEGKLLTPSTSCESQTWGVEVPDPRGRHTDILLFCPRSVTALPWL